MLTGLFDSSYSHILRYVLRCQELRKALHRSCVDHFFQKATCQQLVVNFRSHFIIVVLVANSKSGGQGLNIPEFNARVPAVGLEHLLGIHLSSGTRAE